MYPCASRTSTASARALAAFQNQGICFVFTRGKASSMFLTVSCRGEPVSRTRFRIRCHGVFAFAWIAAHVLHGEGIEASRIADCQFPTRIRCGQNKKKDELSQCIPSGRWISAYPASYHLSIASGYLSPYLPHRQDAVHCLSHPVEVDVRRSSRNLAIRV